MSLLLLLACSGPDTSACAEGGTGTLHVSLTLPSGLSWVTAPSLGIYSGDGALVGTVTDADASLDLPGGVYTLAARRGVTDPGTDLTGDAYGLLVDTVQQVCVADATTTEWSATWERQPSSGKLWVTSGEFADGFDRDALLGGGAQSPAASFQVETSNDIRGFAVDPFGNIWVATSPTYGTRLVVYPPAGVTGGADAIELAGDIFAAHVQIQDILFDSKDQLWVLINGDDSATVVLWAFSPEQALALLATGALPTAPAQQLVVTGMVSPEDMVQAEDGRLWVADFGGNQVLRVGIGHVDNPDVVTVSPEDVFAASWDDETGVHTLDGPTALGLDAAGRLWVDYWTSVTLARFDGEPTVAGVRVPDLRVTGDILDLPAGFAADAQRGVWYGSEPGDGTGELVCVDAEVGSELARGSITTAPVQLTFDP